MMEDQYGLAMRALSLSEGHKPMVPQVARGGLCHGQQARRARTMEVLQKTGKVHYRELAKALGTSPSGALDNLRTLIREGIVGKVGVQTGVYELKDR